MARAAVLELLRGDGELVALGGDGFDPETMIVAQFSYDQRPSSVGPFIVICWRTTPFSGEVQENAEKRFDVYVHIPIAVSTDFGRVDAMLDRIDTIFAAVEGFPVTGGDGMQLNYVGFRGRGPDQTDEGYETICRPASYMALSCSATDV